MRYLSMGISSIHHCVSIEMVLLTLQIKYSMFLLFNRPNNQSFLNKEKKKSIISCRYIRLVGDKHILKKNQHNEIRSARFEGTNLQYFLKFGYS